MRRQSPEHSLRNAVMPKRRGRCWGITGTPRRRTGQPASLAGLLLHDLVPPICHLDGRCLPSSEDMLPNILTRQNQQLKKHQEVGFFFSFSVHLPCTSITAFPPFLEGFPLPSQVSKDACALTGVRRLHSLLTSQDFVLLTPYTSELR